MIPSYISAKFWSYTGWEAKELSDKPGELKWKILQSPNAEMTKTCEGKWTEYTQQALNWK